MKTNIYNSESKSAHLMRVTFAVVLTILLANYASAQDAPAQTIKGYVKAEADNEPLPGVNIYLKGSMGIGTFTDAKGWFEFPRQLKAGDVITFSFMGYETVDYIVSGQAADPIEIRMVFDPLVMVEEALVEGEEPARKFAMSSFFRKVKRGR